MSGSITKRGNSWTVRISCGFDAVSGKRLQRTTTVRGGRRDAERVLTRMLHERDTGVEQPLGRMTLGAWLEKWLREYAEPNLAPKTVRSYADTVRFHIVPTLGSVPLTKLRPSHVQGLYSRTRRVHGDAPLSPTSVRRVHQVLRTALAHARRLQLIGSNPCEAVVPPRANHFEVPAIDAETVRAILGAASSTPYAVLVETAIMTGLRQEELLGARWEDLDLDAGVLSVRQVVQWLPGRSFTFKAPKTASSRRAAALPPGIVAKLRQHRVKQAEERLRMGGKYIDHGLTFATPLGTPIDPSNLRRAWADILADAGVGHLRWHDLRHGCATLMLSAGVHPKIVSERLGHSGVGITLNLYSHVTPTMQRQAADNLEKLIASR